MVRRRQKEASSYVVCLKILISQIIRTRATKKYKQNVSDQVCVHVRGEWQNCTISMKEQDFDERKRLGGTKDRKKRTNELKIKL